MVTTLGDRDGPTDNFLRAGPTYRPPALQEMAVVATDLVLRLARGVTLNLTYLPACL